MKKVLILLAVLVIAATPAMASTKLEAGHGKKLALNHHVETKHQKKVAKKKAVKKAQKKVAKHAAKKHKAAV